jgi:hypothetical protein
MGTKLGLVAFEGDHLADFARLLTSLGLKEVEGTSGTGGANDVQAWTAARKPRRNHIKVVGRLRGDWATFWQEDAWSISVTPFQPEVFAAYLLRQDVEPLCAQLLRRLSAQENYRRSGPAGYPRLLIGRGYGVSDVYHFKLFHAAGVRSISSAESTLLENRGAPFPEEPRGLIIDEGFGEAEVFALMKAVGVDMEVDAELAERGPFVFGVFQIAESPWWKFW